MPGRRKRAFTRQQLAVHGQARVGARPQPPTDLAHWMAGKSYIVVPLTGFDHRQTYLLMESGPSGEAFLPKSFDSLDGVLRAKAEIEGALAVDREGDGDRGGKGPAGDDGR